MLSCQDHNSELLINVLILDSTAGRIKVTNKKGKRNDYLYEGIQVEGNDESM